MSLYRRKRLTSDKTDTDVAQTSNTELFEYLKDENKRLIEENRRLQEEISESNIRKDTLVLQFTERLSEQRQLIEEIRRPWWKRWRRPQKYQPICPICLSLSDNPAINCHTAYQAFNKPISHNTINNLQQNVI